MKKVRLNIGCGKTITEWWINIDGSPSVRLAAFPLFAKLLKFASIISAEQYEFMVFIKTNNIQYGNVTKSLNFNDNSINAIYSSHMLEHLNRDDCGFFFKRGV